MREIRHAVQIPEQNSIRKEEEENVPPRSRTLRERRQTTLRLCRTHGCKERREHLAERFPAQGCALERAKDPPVEPEFSCHMSERGEFALRARVEHHCHRQIEHE